LIFALGPLAFGIGLRKIKPAAVSAVFELADELKLR